MEFKTAFERSRCAAWLTGSLLALMASACATTPRDIAPPRTPQSFAAGDSLQMSADPSGNAQAANWPSDRWWNEVGDEQLDRLIEEGLQGAADIRVAAARFDRANAVAGIERSRLLPSISAGGSVTVEKQSYHYVVPEAVAPRGWNDAATATVGLSWDPDFWGRNRAALAAAKSDAKAVGAEAAAARLAVSTGIAAAYADLAALHADRDTVEQAVSVRGRTVEIIARRHREGLENEGALSRVRSALASAEGDRVAVDELIGLTRARIAALMGAGPDRGLGIERPNISLDRVPGLPANLPADLLGRRADIVAARYRTEASASRIKQARAGFYPSVNLAGLVGVQALGVGDLAKSGAEFGAVGPAISLPIFQGGRLKASYRGAEADYDAAVAQYDGTLTNALREVADAATSSRALEARLDRARDAQAQAQAAWRVADQRYRGGLATYLDVLTAEDALVASERQLAALQARAFSLHVATVRALGGGFKS